MCYSFCKDSVFIDMLLQKQRGCVAMHPLWVENQVVCTNKAAQSTLSWRKEFSLLMPLLEAE